MVKDLIEKFLNKLHGYRMRYFSLMCSPVPNILTLLFRYKTKVNFSQQCCS